VKKDQIKMEQEIIAIEQSIPVRYKTDIFVAGGGPAGVAAALTAARQGKQVFLAEGGSCFGGMGTAALVPAYMCFSDGIHFLAAGIGEEIYQKLKQYAWLPIDAPDSVVSINVEALKRVYDDLMVASDAAFLFQTQVIGLKTEGSQVQYAICAAKSGLFAVKARIFVDATGDGDLAVWAGATYEKGDPNGNMMPGTLCSLWSDIDWEAVNASPVPQDSLLEKAFTDGLFTIQDRHLPGMFRIGKHTGGGNIGHTFGVDGTDESSLTQALLWGRKVLPEYETYYKQYLKGFEAMNLVSTGAMGLRETRRIIGDYVLCREDFTRRAVFEDEIGRYNYPVDIHATKPDKTLYAQFEDEFARLRYQKGESYGIPYRILTPHGLDNLLVAGRCVSTDRYLQGSIRVMPGCYITGQAAGMAAALAVEHGTTTRGVPINELQQRLINMGAYLPNA
jgi:ribulose 1,5-bisphosphate synthetase/thiazole synthase